MEAGMDEGHGGGCVGEWGRVLAAWLWKGIDGCVVRFAGFIVGYIGRTCDF